MGRGFDIERHRIAPGARVFLIAEAGVNHDGELDRALALVDTAAAVGADAVKFQTFRAERLASAAAAKAEYQLRGSAPGESQQAMLRRLELGREAHRELSARARSLGLVFLSTPFDEGSADLLEACGVPAFKIPSGEITNLGLLRHVARKGRPMLLSTGMASLGEIEAALSAVQESGNPPIALFHCTSAYPAPIEEANLRALGTLRRAFRVPVGYSDHTPGIEVALAAVALGACIVEKHLTLDRDLAGPDHAMSLDPAQWTALAGGVRAVEKALGSSIKARSPSEQEIARVARKSLAAARDLRRGAILEEADLCLLRPGTGFAPSETSLLVGRKLGDDCPAGTLLEARHFE